MNETILPIENTTFTSLYSPSETSARAEDSGVESAVHWLNEIILGFRVWQLAGLSVLLSIVIGFCCCIRFRVPRTKQEIEANYIRRKIIRSFRRELSKISNTEMDEMDLWKALERIRSDLHGVTMLSSDMSPRRSDHRCFRSRFRAAFGEMRARFDRDKHGEGSNVMI